MSLLWLRLSAGSLTLIQWWYLWTCCDYIRRKSVILRRKLFGRRKDRWEKEKGKTRANERNNRIWEGWGERITGLFLLEISLMLNYCSALKSRETTFKMICFGICQPDYSVKCLSRSMWDSHFLPDGSWNSEKHPFQSEENLLCFVWRKSFVFWIVVQPFCKPTAN